MIGMPQASADRKSRRKRPTPASMRNVHLVWPDAFAERVDEIVAERGMSKQEIVMRVLHHAMETNLLYEWIVKPVSPAKSRPRVTQEVATGG